MTIPLILFFTLVASGIQCHSANSSLDCSMLKNGRFILIVDDPLDEVSQNSSSTLNEC